MNEDKVGAERQSPIWNAMDRLDGSITNLEDNTTMMEKRVESILGPSQPEPTGEDSEKAQESALTSSINNNIERVRSTSNRLNELLDRLEI